ncbi:ABC transporter ATP-binding protein [Methylobacterium pseudosasicola]|uniref:Peptide/nickel transport system ATP-binding protein n=1 Tax=Methylobacterium pseudosasicola TaxID=582667 RepID=A0A1I4MFM8_9HYPH|nr:ABC transporter ATP-binding protein [Methylobacterium pseudosasicola]SFM02051.1 peptide/nickel transport system ATP-binding protein [Methylobacterium pseudosasicola]
MSLPILEIDALSLALPTGSDRPFAIESLSLHIGAGETLCVVGESGSGKSLTALATIGLLPKAVRPAGGTIRLAGRDLLGLSERAMRDVRGREIGTIFQEPMTSLNPVMRVRDQIAEAFQAHRVLDAKRRIARTLELIAEVGLPDPAAIAGAYPHELSGGQRQRVMIAMALALEPKLIIADEPTTALDVTTQAQILKLLDALRKKHDTAVLFITHDFGVVSEIADRVAVLQHGILVEQGSAEQVLHHPQDAYTKRLLAAVPSLVPPAPKDLGEAPAAFRVDDLSKTYPGRGFLRRRAVKAADGVSFVIRRGETLGLVGESGSGKSTVGRCVMRLIEPDAGAILIGDASIRELTQRQFQPLRRRVQMVFQDPFASLNPRRRVGHIIAEGPIAQGVPRRKALADARTMLGLVGLQPTVAERYPHEFSGGQRQRIGIARALALQPEVLVADEPVSALDVSVQAQILALLQDLQKRLGLAILFVTHDLRVAAQMCDRIAVMQKGRIVELQPTADLFRAPQHAYTRALLDAVPGRFLRPDFDTCFAAAE